MSRSAAPATRVVCAAQLVEQPRVLDSDDGLSGEVLHQLNLLVGEGADFLAEDKIAPTSSTSVSIGTVSSPGASKFAIVPPVYPEGELGY